MEKTIKTQTLYRSFTVDRAKVDEKARTVELAFSSEAVIERWFGNEILDHSPGSCDLRRLNSGSPLLVDHDTQDHVGVIEKSRIDSDRVGRAVVRFGKSARAEEIWQDVLDGIRSLVSVGYRINKLVRESVEKDVETFRATSWEPAEISLVAVPADINCGVGRSVDSQTFDTRILMPDDPNAPKPPTPPTPPPVPPVPSPQATTEADRASWTKAERERSVEIRAYGKQFGREEDAEKFIAEGKTVEDMRKHVLASLPQAKPLTGGIGMSPKETKRYSLARAIVTMIDKGRLDGLELEASNAVAARIGKPARGFYIPDDVVSGQADPEMVRALRRVQQKRGLVAEIDTAGGYTVKTDVQTGSLIELLRNKMLIHTLGARHLTGLTGNVAIPKVTGGATAYWLSEIGEVPQSQQTFGQLLLTPHRLAADTAYSKELLIQSSIDIEAFVRDDLTTVIALAKDLAAIAGTGGVQPLGILNTSGLATGVTFGAAATFAKFVEFETSLAAANADAGSLAYLTTPAVRGKLKSKPVETGQAVYVWANNQINGYPVYATNQVPSNLVIFGNWHDLIIADWNGLDVVVDPYSLKRTGQIEITITQWTDIGIRHPASFSISADSGAQ